MPRRPAYVAAFAAVLLVAGQLFAFAHEAQVRHVVCAQHGEQLEAVTLTGELDNCEHAHWVGAEGDGGDHTECEIARSLRQTTTPSTGVVAVIVATLLIERTVGPPPIVQIDRDLTRIAPKTSPPA